MDYGLYSYQASSASCMAYLVMTYIIMSYTVMAYIAMTYIVMAGVFGELHGVLDRNGDRSGIASVYTCV